MNLTAELGAVELGTFTTTALKFCAFHQIFASQDMPADAVRFSGIYGGYASATGSSVIESACMRDEVQRIDTVFIGAYEVIDLERSWKLAINPGANEPMGIPGRLTFDFECWIFCTVASSPKPTTENIGNGYEFTKAIPD